MSSFNWKTILIVLCVLVIVVIVVGIVRKEHRHPAEANAPVTVAVAKVTREDIYNEVRIPAEFRPYVEVELHAKVSGYVDKMYVDFGDKVKAGQLLATIEVPELKDQLHSAMAVQQRAEADYTNANLIYTRLLTVSKENPALIAQQDIDTAYSKESTAEAAIAAAKADVERYKTLVNYTKITAPFDGVITWRYMDPGALVPGGTSSESRSMPLLRVSDNYHLRLDSPVSVLYVKDMHVGDTVDAQVESLGNKTFVGKISRVTYKVNEDTRTMIVEVEVPNPNLEIVPGMYAAVVFKVQRETNALTIPTEVVGGASNPTIYVVNKDSEIESRTIKLGLETAQKYEVLSGLSEGELVMVGNRTFVHPGEKVETKLVTQTPPPGERW